MPTNDPHSKTGFPQSCQLILMTGMGSFPDNYYFSCVVTDDKAGNQNPQTWVLLRNMSSSVVDLDPSGDRLPVSYGNISQAIVAIIKDAILSGATITLTGYAFAGPGPAGSRNPVANTFTIHTATLNRP